MRLIIHHEYSTVYSIVTYKQFTKELLFGLVVYYSSSCLVVCLQESRSFPESYPELPKQDTVESSLLQKHVLELATMLEVQSLFWDESLEAY